MILLIDNYDSFVYNLARYFAELGCETNVVRNDEITSKQIQEMQPAAIVLSPGPCTPDEAGISIDVVREFHTSIPILGVCLGHQAIATAFGSEIIQTEPVHGRTDLVKHNGQSLFQGLANPLRATRYHSLAVASDSLSDELMGIAHSDRHEQLLMGIAHRRYPVYGVQFHPESVITDSGHRLLSNFLSLAGIDHQFDSDLILELDQRQSENRESIQVGQEDISIDFPIHW